LEDIIERNHCKRYILHCTKNDFNSIDFGSPIKTKGCSFAASGALTNSIIHMPFVTTLLWSSFFNMMVFPLGTTN
jgi:hypothetical protein